MLGETTLERKCLVFFGTSLFLLIVGSFWWYGYANTKVVYENTRSNCKVLAEAGLFKIHALWWEADSDKRWVLDNLAAKLQHLDYSWECLGLDPPADGETKPRSHMITPDAWERPQLEEMRGEQLARLQRRQEKVDPATSPPATPAETEPITTIYETYLDDAPIWRDRNLVSSMRYDYYQVVEFDRDCVICHVSQMGIRAEPDLEPADMLRELPFFRVIKVSLPFENTQRAINRNYASVLAVAIVTVFLAMLALYGIVRYLIVKPVQHLQHVSEQVERGNYDARADIETHDELEDLAHAFNGMLRHLVEAQNKLRMANIELDGKVDQLAQANMQLYEMNRLKGDFLANVSHELRTPLNSIIGFSDVLKDIESLDERQKRYVMNIRKSGRVLLDMINDILDLAKMESGKMEVRVTEFPIVSIVQAQIDFLKSLADEKNLDISLDCPKTLPPLVQDAGKVGQIIGNLLSNAIKFTPDGGSVRMVIREEPGLIVEKFEEAVPGSLRIEVIDTGVGIAKEDQEAIFEKFRQAGSIRGDNLTREFSGTGLGLSIVRELCKLLGGRVSVESELGRGSKFTVILPWRLPDRVFLGQDGELAETRDLTRSHATAAASQPVTPFAVPFSPRNSST